MSRLTVSAPVAAPAAFTLAFLRSYFEGRSSDVAADSLRLRVPMRETMGGLALETAVDTDVRYVPGHGAPDVLGIDWTPQGTHALPPFNGALATVSAGSDRCRLTLSGAYAPPGGVAGKAFDALVGNRIARASLVDLLHRLGSLAEHDYRLRTTL